MRCPSRLAWTWPATQRFVERRLCRRDHGHHRSEVAVLGRSSSRRLRSGELHQLLDGPRPGQVHAWVDCAGSSSRSTSQVQSPARARDAARLGPHVVGVIAWSRLCAAMATLAAGKTFGRYVLLLLARVDGSGDVHAAYDRVLDSKVALKVSTGGQACGPTRQREGTSSSAHAPWSRAPTKGRSSRGRSSDPQESCVCRVR